jgi:hypothetical protein
MTSLLLVGLVGGYIWGVAGMVGFPGVSWKPGAVLTVACAVWLVAHDAMPAEPLVEAGAIGIFLVLMGAQKRQSRGRAAKPKQPGGR